MQSVMTSPFKLYHNVEYQLKGADGKIKPIFQENGFYQWLMENNILTPFTYQKYPFLQPILGRWSDKKIVRNLITSAGKAGIASRINGHGSEAAFTYVAVGTGTTAANASDTTLETELASSGLSRANGTASRTTTDVTNDTAVITYTFSVSGTQAVTESGILNAGSSGTLLNRQVFSAVNVVSGDSLQITHNFDVD